MTFSLFKGKTYYNLFSARKHVFKSDMVSIIFLFQDTVGTWLMYAVCGTYARCYVIPSYLWRHRDVGTTWLPFVIESHREQTGLITKLRKTDNLYQNGRLTIMERTTRPYTGTQLPYFVNMCWRNWTPCEF